MDAHAHLPVETSGAPIGSGRGVVIMLHGRGAGPHNILELVPLLARPSFTYLAPTAADRSWYPLGFMQPIDQNEPKLSSALLRIRTLLEDLAAHDVSTDRVVLLGFSQGACLAGEFAVRNPTRYGGIVMLSGGLIGPEGTTWNTTGRLAGTPVFLGCSDRDAHIPLARVDESARVFSSMGADVVEQIYPGMGHLVCEDEIVQARAVLDRLT